MAKKEKYTRREVIGTMGAAIGSSALVGLPMTVNAETLQQSPNAWRILKYAFGWNAAQRKGRVRLHLERRRDVVTIDVASPSEFSGYVTILKEEPVFYNSAGWIYTGEETVQ